MKASTAFRISTDPAQLDMAMIHRFLAEESDWASTVPLNIVERAIAHSLCFGLYSTRRQVGFARVVTDAATFGYLADVFIVMPYRGRGLGRRLIAAVVAHPCLQGLQHFMLAAHGARRLYREFGFSAARLPRGGLMERDDSKLPQQLHPAAV